MSSNPFGYRIQSPFSNCNVISITEKPNITRIKLARKKITDWCLVCFKNQNLTLVQGPYRPPGGNIRRRVRSIGIYNEIEVQTIREFKTSNPDYDFYKFKSAEKKSDTQIKLIFENILSNDKTIEITLFLQYNNPFDIKFD